MKVTAVLHWEAGEIRYFAIESGTHKIVENFRKVKVQSQTHGEQLVDDFYSAITSLVKNNKDLKVIYKIKNTAPVYLKIGPIGEGNPLSEPLLTYFRSKFSKYKIIQRKNKMYNKNGKKKGCLDVCKKGLKDLAVFNPPSDKVWKFHLWSFVFAYSIPAASAQKNLEKNWKIHNSYKSMTPQRRKDFLKWFRAL